MLHTDKLCSLQGRNLSSLLHQGRNRGKLPKDRCPVSGAGAASTRGRVPCGHIKACWVTQALSGNRFDASHVEVKGAVHLSEGRLEWGWKSGNGADAMLGVELKLTLYPRRFCICGCLSRALPRGFSALNRNSGWDRARNAK